MNKSTTVTDIDKYLRRAKRNANSHTFDDRLTFRHASVLVAGSKIIANGFNYLHITDLRFDEQKALRAKRLSNENHAEVDALLTGCNKHDTNGMDMYVVRIHRSGELANSRPCILCQRVMAKFGIKRCYYSITPTEFGVMDVRKNAEKFFRVEN
jgi:deoxycytidylate deaminase